MRFRKLGSNPMFNSSLPFYLDTAYPMCMRGGREPECWVSMAWWGAASTTLDSGRVYSDLTGWEGCDEWERLWGGGKLNCDKIALRNPCISLK